MARRLIADGPMKASGPSELPKMRKFHQKNLRHWSKSKTYKDKVSLYRTPLGFTSWREILANLCHYSGVLPQAIQYNQRADIENCVACALALNDDSPLRHLNKEMAESFLRTSLVGIEKPKMPFDHFMINLPEGVLVDDWGEPVIVILVSTIEHLGKSIERVGVKTMGFDMDGLHICGLAKCGTSIIDTSQWKNMGRSIEMPSWVACKGYEKEVADSCIKMQRLAVHSLLMMVHKPDLVTVDQVSSSLTGHGFGSTSSGAKTRDVVWIGKNYKAPARKRTQSDQTEGAPIAPHWRTGHWHTVRYGEGKKNARLDWFEPVYVNGTQQTQDATNDF